MRMKDSVPRRGKRGKRSTLLSMVCALAVLCSALLSVIPAADTVKAVENSAQLSNLIIDKVYELTPIGGVPEGVTTNDIGFAPEIMEYNGTAYRSVDEIQVYPFAASDTATVTVNDQQLNGNGYVTVNVTELGTYDIAVTVSEGGSTNTYTVHVEKTDMDYRGRRPVIENEAILSAMTVQSDYGNTDELMNILKKDYEVTLPETTAVNSYVNTDETYWSVAGANLPNAEPGTTLPNENDGDHGVFTIDLGDVYSVSRIRAVFGPSNLNLAQNRARISVSTDGVNWETPVTKGNLNTGTQYHQNVTRYEFGVSYDARYIRFDVVNWQNTQNELRIYQFMVFYDAGETPEEQPAPEGGSVAHQHEERHQYLASGQATVIERGLTISGWTPSSGYGRGIPTPEESEQFGYDGPLFYDPDFENPDYMLYNPDALWGIAKAPYGGNNMASVGEPADFIPDSMKPYLANAISFCFGDEGAYSTSEAEAFGKWFEWTRQHYPGVILHTNQWPGLWNRNQLIEYMRIAEPDMLCWDDYYGDASYAKPSTVNLANQDVQKNAVRRLLNLSHWEMYRELAYGGIDGTGAKPILFGQYLDAFAFNKPESVKNLIVNTSILSGAKWLNFFRLEYQFDRAYLYDEDGTPTRGLLEWGQIIDRIHAIDDQLTRLNNDWIMFKVGGMGNTDNENVSADGFRMGDFDAPESAQKNQEFGISNVEMTSLSDAHDRQTGDVVLGYFNTLTGLYESESEEYFMGATAPKAFMVMNGLAAGQDEKYNQFNIPAREAGAANNTQQEITITVDAGFAANNTLYMVDKDDVDENGSGRIKEVILDENNSFTVTLGGGEANLYFWDTDATATASSAGEGTYASFAFDLSKETYWQPAEVSQDGVYTLENTFAPAKLEKVTLLERGNTTEAYQVEYMDENGEWQPFGEGAAVGAALDVTAGAPVTAQGIRVTLTSASGLPALYSVDLTTSEPDGGNTENTVTVNDNTMGDSLFRFNYDNLWSYRETETNDSTMSGQYPLENDGHFSNWSGAEATFKFYGTGVELLLRANQAANIKAAVFAEDGTTVVQDWITGTNGQRNITFADLSSENAVYILKIQKVNTDQAGIDGATVTYKGALSDSLFSGNADGSKAVQTYVDQRTVDTAADNYFTYEPEPVSKTMGTNNSGFNADSDEDGKWVEHVQNAQYQNLGFTRTKADNASYTLTFYGTGVTLFSGVTPMGDTDADRDYGTLTFTLDGVDVTEQVKRLNTEELGTNGKVSAGMWQVSVADATTNETHTLKVTVTGGYNRIDYAVVDSFYEEGGTSINTFAVTTSAGENGSIQLESGDRVNAGGNIIAQIFPDSSYQISKILVNNVSVPIPEDGRLVITNVRQDTSISVTFAAAVYNIQIASGMTGGTLAPSAFAAAEGTVVTVTPEVYADYQLVAGSVTVTAEDGTNVPVMEVENGYTFTMPASGVTISASFASALVDKAGLEAVISQAQGLVAGDYTPESFADMTAALTTAQDVLGNTAATQEQVDAAAAALEQAINNLVPASAQVDRTELQQLVNEIDQIDLTQYTAASAEAMQAALSSARAILSDPAATQQQITDAINALNTARSQLVPATDPGAGGNTGGNAGGDQTAGSGNAANSAVNTGDNTPLWMYLSLAVMALAGLMVSALIKKKR